MQILSPILCERISTNQEIFNDYCEYIDSLLSINTIYPWTEYKNSPKQSGIYVLRYNDAIVYIGETSNIHNRLVHHKNGNGSALKTKIADSLVTELPEDYLQKCTIQYIPMLLGRTEIEKYLIDKYNPVFNNYNLRKRYGDKNE